jgi:putative DNA primase/helicase
VLRCHAGAGCEAAAIAGALGLQMADLFDDAGERSNGHRSSGARGTIVATYDYRSADGVLVYQVVRLEPKSFRQRRPDGSGGWTWNLRGVTPILYRLPELRAADPAAPVYITEGEKDVDRLRSLGACATCNSGGAGKWRDVYGTELRRRHVVIVADWDGPATSGPGFPGERHALEVARSLRGVAASVAIVHAAQGKDASDHLDAGLTLEQLVPVTEMEIVARVAGGAPALASEAPGDGRSYPRTDLGNGELFAELHGDSLRYDHARGRWLTWAGHLWAPDVDGEVLRLAKRTARERYTRAAAIGDLKERELEARWAISSESRHRLEATLALARAERPIADTGTRWDTEPDLLGCPNGVLDLREGRLRPGRQTDRLTMSTAVPFDPDAKAPRFEKFLLEVFSDDADLVDFVQRALGYTATAHTVEQAFFLCLGSGANGKTEFLKAVRRPLGDYGYNASFATFEQAARPSIPNDVAALAGRRLVTASETNEGARLNEARVKALTGGDPLTARFLNAEFFTFTPALKLWLAVNHRPRVTDDSHGFWRRVRLVPFLRQFRGAEQDRELEATLRAEAPGILAWIVRGCLAWRERGLAAPASVLAATEEYRVDSDPLADFLAERCVTGDSSYSVPAAAFYRAYGTWCDHRGLGASDRLTGTAFGRRMAERFERRHGVTGKAYIGVGLLIEEDGEQQLSLTGSGEKPVRSGSVSISSQPREEKGSRPSNPSARQDGTGSEWDL